MAQALLQPLTLPIILVYRTVGVGLISLVLQIVMVFRIVRCLVRRIPPEMRA